jgi:hypothetical protein
MDWFGVTYAPVRERCMKVKKCDSGDEEESVPLIV